MFAALALGADMAYIGTRFLATTEAQVPGDYKQMIVDSSSDEVVYTSLFTGVKGNYLARSVAALGFDPANLPGGRQVEDELRFGRQRGKEGLARHLERRPGRRQHP